MTDPAVQRYLIAWRERERAREVMLGAESKMIASEMDTRRAIGRGMVEAGLLTGDRYQLSLGPNGYDVMVMPLPARRLTATELARETGKERREVITLCVELGVPISEGRIDRDAFVAALATLEDKRS